MYFPGPSGPLKRKPDQADFSSYRYEIRRSRVDMEGGWFGLPVGIRLSAPKSRWLNRGRLTTLERRDECRRPKRVVVCSFDPFPAILAPIVAQHQAAQRLVASNPPSTIADKGEEMETDNGEKETEADDEGEKMETDDKGGEMETDEGEEGSSMFFPEAEGIMDTQETSTMPLIDDPSSQPSNTTLEVSNIPPQKPSTPLENPCALPPPQNSHTVTASPPKSHVAPPSQEPTEVKTPPLNPKKRPATPAEGEANRISKRTKGEQSPRRIAESDIPDLDLRTENSCKPAPGSNIKEAAPVKKESANINIAGLAAAFGQTVISSHKQKREASPVKTVEPETTSSSVKPAEKSSPSQSRKKNAFSLSRLNIPPASSPPQTEISSATTAPTSPPAPPVSPLTPPATPDDLDFGGLTLSIGKPAIPLTTPIPEPEQKKPSLKKERSSKQNIKQSSPVTAAPAPAPAPAPTPSPTPAPTPTTGVRPTTSNPLHTMTMAEIMAMNARAQVTEPKKKNIDQRYDPNEELDTDEKIEAFFDARLEDLKADRLEEEQAPDRLAEELARVFGVGGL